MAALGHQDDARAQASDAEVRTVAVVAARYFQNHPARALGVLHPGRYPSGALSVSRFSRRLHALRGWLGLALEALGAVFAHGEVFPVDSMPVPTCGRARARRSTKLRGKASCGYCAAKRERFFGWRLHLVCTPTGVPVALDPLPGGLHDLTPIHELCYVCWPKSISIGQQCLFRPDVLVVKRVLQQQSRPVYRLDVLFGQHRVACELLWSSSDVARSGAT